MAKQPLIVAASLLAADFADLGGEARRVLAAGAEWLHFDVMDNHYVPNLSIGAPVCKSLRHALPESFLDVHLMTAPVDTLIAPFAAAGANRLTFHPDASRHPHRTAAAIADAGMRCGAALNPATPLSVLEYLLPHLDLVLLMTVNPGFGGQCFLPGMTAKIESARRLLDQFGGDIRLQVDGGINARTGRECWAAGADVLAAGQTIFAAADYKTAIDELRGAAQ